MTSAQTMARLRDSLLKAASSLVLVGAMLLPCSSSAFSSAVLNFAPPPCMPRVARPVATCLLAPQQQCLSAGAFDNNGCNGGLPSHAFEYIAHTGGISTETAYPYYAKDHDCTVDTSTFALNVEGGSVNITEGDETEMLHALFEVGPVSIAF